MAESRITSTGATSTGEPRREPRIAAWVVTLANGAAWAVEHWDEIRDVAEDVGAYVTGDGSASEAAAALGELAGSLVDDVDYGDWTCEERKAYLDAAFTAVTGKVPPRRRWGDWQGHDEWRGTYDAWLADCEEWGGGSLAIWGMETAADLPGATKATTTSTSITGGAGTVALGAAGLLGLGLLAKRRRRR